MPTVMIGRTCGMRSPSPYGVAEDGVSSTLSIFNRIGTSLHQGPHAGRRDSNQHPLVALPLSYTPCGRRSTRPRLSNRHASASYWRSTGRKTIHGSTAAWTSPATPPRQRVRGTVSTSVNGSQAGQDSNLQHTVPKTIVLPIAPPAYMPVCASTHPLDTIRRPGCDGHRPP